MAWYQVQGQVVTEPLLRLLRLPELYDISLGINDVLNDMLAEFPWFGTGNRPASQFWQDC